MTFPFSAEQEELRNTVRRFLEAKTPSSEIHRLMELPGCYDQATWSQMGSQLGLQGLHIPESYGGQGFTFAELAIVAEELGRALACVPFFSSVCLAANAILNAGSEQQKVALLPGIASGETVATLAFTEPEGRWDVDSITMMATPTGEGSWRLDGSKSFVIDGCAADLVVVAARVEEDLALFVVPGVADGLTRSPLPTMDQTRMQALLEFSGVEAERLGGAGDARRPLMTTLQQAAVCLSAEMVGGAQRCLEMAVAYAKDRVQFGRPIGSFQAIKHKCADMLLKVESAKAAAYDSTLNVVDGGDLALAAHFTKSYCADAYFQVAADNLQIHGGIGFTWEHDAHLYLKRAKSSSLILGDSTCHRALLADHLDI